VLALLAACGAGATATSHTSNPPCYEPVPAAPAEVEEPAATQVRAPTKEGACLQPSTRRFVGFSHGMSLGDFDLAARESKQIMVLVAQTLCARAQELEPSGALAKDLAAHSLELFEVQFVRDDAGAADVGLRDIESPTDERGLYRLAMVRGDRGWELIAVRRL
jgi:hypothetical protein